MIQLRPSQPHRLVLLTCAATLAACGGPSKMENANTAPTPATHSAFAIASGPHAVDCAKCHGTFASFKEFDCLGCHGRPATDAVHLTTADYRFASASCLACHAQPKAHPFDHAGVSLTGCASCHDAGAAYASLPMTGFDHGPTAGADCSACHVIAAWSNVLAPAGLVADPERALSITTWLPRFSGSTMVDATPNPALLPMEMRHASTQVNLTGLACSACHPDAAARIYFPGRLHSPLANLSLPQPAGCGDCHGGAAPGGLVGPIATSPARTPATGEMKHDAVAWSAAGPTGVRLVTADCGACHLPPSAAVQATWATDRSGGEPARYHAALTAAGLAQPSSCVDCHANCRPAALLSAASASLPAGVAFDHAAATGDCAACHAAAAPTWTGGRFHLAASANPASCLPCHAGERPVSSTGWTSPGFAAAPFDYGTNPAGVTHGGGLDCAACHRGPGTGGAWGGQQRWTGGHFTHGPGSAAATTCIACHASQRPDLVLGQAAAASALAAFDHALDGTGDCIGCHQATAAAKVYARYFGPGGALPGGDWKGGVAYPGDALVSAPSQVITITELTLVRATPGGPITGVTSTRVTRTNAFLHVSAAIPAEVSPGPARAPDGNRCWHCHTHDASGLVTSFADGEFHAALRTFSATPGGPVTPLPQPTTGCADCHAQSQPAGVVELAASTLRPMDHAARFAAPVRLGGQTAAGVADLECAACHARQGDTWADGVFHASVGAAVPAACAACHYPLMADAASADVRSGAVFQMRHASRQAPSQDCAACHATALAQASATPPAAASWKTGALHASLPLQPAACLECHAVSAPAAGAPTQSRVTYFLAAGGTASNGGQWMSHAVPALAGLDCATCHAADARASGSAWSKDAPFHAKVTSPGACQGCHGLTNGGGAVPGTGNNLPVGLTSSSTVTSAASDPLTWIPAGTLDQISHADLNVTGHDCAYCHTQAGPSTAAGVQGKEWAQARFHASFSATVPLVLNGTTGRCSNCHLNVRPGAGFTAQPHAAFTAVAGSQDCSACHAWPGTGTAAAPNWLGGSGTPQFITVGGFLVPRPPAASATTTQAGIAGLPHPTVAAGATCATCHAGGVGGKQAIGYDHRSAVGNTRCSACHEAGSNLVGKAWGGGTSQTAGTGDTRPFTLTSLLARRNGSANDTCTIKAANHFYPVDCAECHKVPAGNGLTTSGTAYTAAWIFPHAQSKMSNPSTCNLCHTGNGCSK